MANEVPEALGRPVALLFGDSLTERSMDSDGGWGAALYHHFARKVRGGRGAFRMDAINTKDALVVPWVVMDRCR